MDSQEQAERYAEARKLISVLAHDARTPFATLQSFLNILEMDDYVIDAGELKELSASLSESLRKALDNVDEKVMQLRKLLEA